MATAEGVALTATAHDATATRGGVGTVLYEIAEQSKVGIRLNQTAIPVDGAVKGVCGMLGLEPLYLACEGRLVVFAPKELAPAIVEASASSSLVATSERLVSATPKASSSPAVTIEWLLQMAT